MLVSRSRELASAQGRVDFVHKLSRMMVLWVLYTFVDKCFHDL